MTRDTLSRQAIRLAQRNSKKAGRPLTREEVLHMQVQTVEPWKRILIVLVGVLAGAITLLFYRVGAPWWIWGPSALGATTIVGLGIFGRKAYLNRELKKLSDEGPQRIIDAIINAL